jgi:hypothetical protein
MMMMMIIIITIIIMSMGGHQRAYWSSSRQYMNMENYGGMMSTEENSFVHHSSLAILPAGSSGSKQEEWAKRMSLALRSIFVHTCDFLHVISLHEAPRLYVSSGRKTLRILIGLKNPSPRPGF